MLWGPGTFPAHLSFFTTQELLAVLLYCKLLTVFGSTHIKYIYIVGYLHRSVKGENTQYINMKAYLYFKGIFVLCRKYKLAHFPLI